MSEAPTRMLPTWSQSTMQQCAQTSQQISMSCT